MHAAVVQHRWHTEFYEYYCSEYIWTENPDAALTIYLFPTIVVRSRKDNEINVHTHRLLRAPSCYQRRNIIRVSDVKIFIFSVRLIRALSSGSLKILSRSGIWTFAVADMNSIIQRCVHCELKIECLKASGTGV